MPRFGSFLELGGISAVLFVVGMWLRLRCRRSAVLSLQGKVVLITGASSGLGEACAHAFYRAGCKVILSARRTDQLERVVAELKQIKLDIVTYEPRTLSFDLSELSAISLAAQRAISFHGHIDIVVNNAGVSFHGEIERTNIDVDIAVMAINYFGQVALIKAILPNMIDRRSGHIVGISSVQGKLAIPFRSAYGASKHAMQSFFNCLRAEAAHYGIKVTVISPSYIKTNLSLNALAEDGLKSGEVEEDLLKGMSTEYVATRVLESVAYGHNDVVVGPLAHRLAAYLNTVFPNLFCWIMETRARKQRVILSKHS